jgi:hypothetical protein
MSGSYLKPFDLSDKDAKRWRGGLGARRALKHWPLRCRIVLACADGKTQWSPAS